MSIIVKAKYKKGFFAKKVSIESFMNNVADINEEKNYNAILTKYGENEFTMEIIPGGIIHFNVTETNLSIESVTSFLGAGYHKCVIDVIEELAKKMNLNFDIDDETDYHANKAFPYLQKMMHKDLLELLEKVVSERESNPSGTSHYLAWTNPWYPTNQLEIVTPFGSYTLNEIKKVLENNLLEDFAKNYFIWYNEYADALYHRQMALYALWNTYKWRSPLGPDESQTAGEIARHLELARIIDNDITLPLTAWQEICQFNGIPYLNLNESATYINPRLGYLKNKIHFTLPHDYGIKLEGSYQRNVEDGAIILRNQDNFIRIQPMIENRPGMIMDPRRMLQRVDFRDEIEGYLYVGQFEEQQNNHGERFYTFTAIIQGSASFANVTIMYHKDEDKEWAINTLKSIETPYAPPINFAMLG